jgi:hypothetical protein
VADLDSEFAFLAAAARRSIDLLKDYPARNEIRANERGSTLLAHVQYVLAGIDAKLADAEANFGGAADVEKGEYIKRARLLHSFGRFMHRSLPWMAEAARPPLALGALYFIDELAVRICGTKPDAVPNSANEYSTEWWPFQRLFAQLGLAHQGGPVPIILNFPSPEAESHLLLPLYAHELGHTAVWSNGLAQRVVDTHATDLTFATAFNAARDASAAQLGITQREAGINIGWRLDRWITELLCDQLGAQVLGPSFVYAFSSFLLSDAWDEPGERHPPTCIRVGHLLAYLDDSSWSATVDARTPLILKWLREEVAATTPKAADETTKFLTYAMTEVEPTVRDEVSMYLGDQVFAPGASDEGITMIEDLVAFETLPVQLPHGDPIELRTLMLAAWFSVIDGADNTASLAKAPADHESQAFFAKAIEMSAVLSRWKAVP